MFIAGIEIFFGFVAGAILLALLISLAWASFRLLGWVSPHIWAKRLQIVVVIFVSSVLGQLLTNAEAFTWVAALAFFVLARLLWSNYWRSRGSIPKQFTTY